MTPRKVTIATVLTVICASLLATNGAAQLIGDLDGNGVLEPADIDLLTLEMIADQPRDEFDLNADGLVDQQDHTYWINDIANTWPGDANLDGVFETGDFVTVFKAAEFIDDIDDNSTWAEGDWNGDLDFDVGDLVASFQGGCYSLGPRLDGSGGGYVGNCGYSRSAVPEPSSCCLITAVGLILACFRRAAKRKCVN